MTLQTGYGVARAAPQLRPMLRLVGAAGPAPDPRALAVAQSLGQHAALRHGEAVLLVLTPMAPGLPVLARLLLDLGRQAGADLTALCPAELAALVRAGGGRRIVALTTRPGYAVILDPFAALDPLEAEAALRPSGRYLRFGTLPIPDRTGLRPEVFLCNMPATWPREVFGGVITRLTQPASSRLAQPKSEFPQ